MALLVTGKYTHRVRNAKLIWHSRIGTFLGHKGAVWQSRISSDASVAITGSGDFTA